MGQNHMPPFRALAYHLRTKSIYRIIGEARCARTNKVYVVYEQTFCSTDRLTGADIPKNTKWVREKVDFIAKFRRLSSNQKN